MSREESRDAIDEKLRSGSIDDTMPSEIEAAARRRFEDESRSMTGNVWDWGTAGDEVRNRYRLRVFISRWRAASTEGG